MAKILIIEDDESLRAIYAEEFANEGFETEIASDGIEGINKMLAVSPDIVLLDILMPGVNGFEVLRKRNSDPKLKEIPVIVITNIYPDTNELVQKWGASEVLIKVDHTPGEIVGRVRSLLRVNPS